MTSAKPKRAQLQRGKHCCKIIIVAVDIAGSFPTTSSDCKFICITMDCFTKWPEIYVIPNHEATTIAEVLLILEFKATVFQECCQLMGIRKTHTISLRLQSDGMAERLNCTLIQELAKCCEEGQPELNCKIPLPLMAYCSAEHKATTFSPAS